MDPFYFDMQEAGDDDDYLMSLGGLILPPPPAQGRAFAAYQRCAATLLAESSLTTSRQRSSSGGRANVHRRMFGYLRRIGHDDAAAASTGPVVGAHQAPADRPVAPPQAQRSTRFQRIMRERLRREHLSQGFADLHALLPAGASKGCKNDIVAAAAGYIRELEGRKEWFRARSKELLAPVATASARSGGGSCGGMLVKVRAESEHHTVAVDVFETVLRRLKAMEELRVTAIRSRFCGGGMWMDVGVEGEISSCEVDKAITNALMEIEEKELGMQDPRSNKPSFICQVESDALMS